MKIQIETAGKQPKVRNIRNITIDSGEKNLNNEIILGQPLRQQRPSPQAPTQASPSSPPPVSSQPARKVKQANNIIKTAGSVVLQKGQKSPIDAKISSISNLLVALVWDFKSPSKAFDIDVSIFMTDQNNKTEDHNFIFYNNVKSRDGGVELKSDANLGVSRCYDEVVKFNLSLIPANIQKLAITFTTDGQNNTFADLSNAGLKLIDTAKKEEFYSFNFGEGFTNETAMVVAEIYRYKTEWKISTIGSGFNGGLDDLCHNYGIATT